MRVSEREGITLYAGRKETVVQLIPLSFFPPPTLLSFCFCQGAVAPKCVFLTRKSPAFFYVLAKVVGREMEIVAQFVVSPLSRRAESNELGKKKREQERKLELPPPPPQKPQLTSLSAFPLLGAICELASV